MNQSNNLSLTERIIKKQKLNDSQSSLSQSIQIQNYDEKPNISINQQYNSKLNSKDNNQIQRLTQLNQPKEQNSFAQQNLIYNLENIIQNQAKQIQDLTVLIEKQSKMIDAKTNQMNKIINDKKVDSLSEYSDDYDSDQKSVRQQESRGDKNKSNKLHTFNCANSTSIEDNSHHEELEVAVDKNIVQVNPSLIQKEQKLELPNKINQELFKRISQLVEEQEKKNALTIQKAKDHMKSLEEQEKRNFEILVDNHEFYCHKCQIPFTNADYLKRHNDNFHLNQSNNRNSQKIQFTCKVCKAHTFQTKIGCANHENICLQSYVEMLNSQAGKSLFNIKPLTQEEKALIQYSTKVLRDF